MVPGALGPCLRATLGLVPVEAVALQWEAPPQCPTADAVRDELERLLGSEVAQLTEPLSVEARIEGEPDRYVLELELVSPSGRNTRSIPGPRCEELAFATALIVATMVDPIAVSESLISPRVPAVASVVPPPEPIEADPIRTEPTMPHAPIATPSAATPASPRSPRSWKPSGSLRLSGFAGVASVPRVDAGLAFVAGVVLPHARVELGAMHVFAQPISHPELEDVRMQVRATMGVVRGCGVPTLRNWEFPVCGGVELGVMSAVGEGSGVSDVTRARSFYGDAFAEVHVVWRVSSLVALWLGGQGLVALARPSFTVGTLEPFFVAAVGGGRGYLGLELRFP